MSIDPLSEKYVHNGVYNFSENRVIDARELEGLEAVKVTDLKNNQVNVTVKVKPVNATLNHKLDDEKFKVALNRVKTETEKVWSGKNKEGQNVKVTIVYDSEATITLKFSDLVENKKIDSSSNKDKDIKMQIANAQGAGFVAPEDHGNTQNNEVQISTYNTYIGEDNKNGNVEIGRTGAHEFGHMFGNGHFNLQSNVMNDLSPGPGASSNEEQRSEMLNNIPETTKR
jgi:hypothetical protein